MNTLQLFFQIPCTSDVSYASFFFPFSAQYAYLENTHEFHTALDLFIFFFSLLLPASQPPSLEVDVTTAI